MMRKRKILISKWYRHMHGTGKNILQKHIDIGEGLVGQTAIEKGTIYITDVPDNFVTITSGLG